MQQTPAFQWFFNHNKQPESLGSIIGPDLHIMDTSQRLAKLMGFEHAGDMIGCTDYDVKAPAVKHAAIFQAHDIEVLSTQKTLYLLELITCHKNERKCIMTKKIPLLNEKGKSSALALLIEELNPDYLKRLGIFSLLTSHSEFSYTNITYRLIERFNHLTQRESEVLFFLIRGKTAKEIALILGGSFRTIEAHFNKIKSKLSCHSKSQVIEYSHLKRYVYHLPISIIGRSLKSL